MELVFTRNTVGKTNVGDAGQVASNSSKFQFIGWYDLFINE